MSAAEKNNLVPRLREEGNEMYIRGDYEAASRRYREALGILDQLCLHEKPGDADWVQLDKRKVPFFVNLAQCLFKMKVWTYISSLKSIVGIA